MGRGSNLTTAPGAPLLPAIVMDTTAIPGIDTWAVFYVFCSHVKHNIHENSSAARGL